MAKFEAEKYYKYLGYLGLERKPEDEASAGDIVAITGIENLRISDTLCDPANVEALTATRC